MGSLADGSRDQLSSWRTAPAASSTIRLPAANRGYIGIAAETHMGFTAINFWSFHFIPSKYFRIKEIGDCHFIVSAHYTTPRNYNNRHKVFIEFLKAENSGRVRLAKSEGHPLPLIGETRTPQIRWSPRLAPSFSAVPSGLCCLSSLPGTCFAAYRAILSRAFGASSY
jgi:hypothetical protein